MNPDERSHRVRRFDRFYTRQIGSCAKACGEPVSAGALLALACVALGLAPRAD